MSWTLFPIYSLKITEPDAWLDDRLFEDATLVSMAACENHLKERLDDQYHPMLAHGKLSESVDISSLGLPMDQSLETRPTFFPGKVEVKRIGGPIRLRHRITHEGAVDDLEKVKEAARDGLILGWTMLDIATAFDSMATTFDDYIRLLIDAHDLDEHLGRLGDASGLKYETTLRERIPKFIKLLTIKANFPDAPSE
jgi:hypothetical protein